MKVWLTKSFPPFFTFEDKCNYGERKRKGNHSKYNPGILSPNFLSKRNGIETHGETVYLSDQRYYSSKFGRLWFIALYQISRQTINERIFIFFSTYIGSIRIYRGCGNLKSNTGDCDSHCNTNPTCFML